jgi:hypothetical protein
VMKARHANSLAGLRVRGRRLGVVARIASVCVFARCGGQWCGARCLDRSSASTLSDDAAARTPCSTTRRGRR